MIEKKYRVCKECTPSHIENCETCFGWGVYSPILGDCVHGGDLDNLQRPVIPCPECGSDEHGVPKGFVE